MKVNWFQAHPNVTAILGMSMAFTLGGLGSLDLLETMTVGLGALIFYFAGGFDTREFIFALVGLAVCLPVLLWTLKQKNKSPWLILIAFIPFGWLAFPFLGNNDLDRVTAEREETLLFKIREYDFFRNLGYHQISDEEYGELKRELRVIQSLDKYGRVRQVFCWVAIAATVILIIFAAKYELPILERYSDVEGEWVIKDYRAAPLWVRLGSEHGIIFLVVDGFFLYGALREAD